MIELDGITQEFTARGGRVRAVDAVNLTLEPGKVLCLVGESGSGKTTTARIATGLTKPSSGVVRFEGADVHQLTGQAYTAFRRGVQYIHQDPYASLNPIRDVFGTLAAPLRRHNLVRGRKEAWQRAAALLSEVDLTPAENFLTKYPHQL